MTDLERAISAAMRSENQPSGKRGIRNVGDLKLRCCVDRESGCWAWRGAVDDIGRPRMKMAHVAAYTIGIGIALAILVTGSRPPKGIEWHPVKCGNRQCGRPSHYRPITRGESMWGRQMPASARLRISAKRRANSHLSEQQCDAIRASTEPSPVVARLNGCSASYVRRLRALTCRKPMHGLVMR